MKHLRKTPITLLAILSLSWWPRSRKCTKLSEAQWGVHAPDSYVVLRLRWKLWTVPYRVNCYLLPYNLDILFYLKKQLYFWVEYCVILTFYTSCEVYSEHFVYTGSMGTCKNIKSCPLKKRNRCFFVSYFECEFKENMLLIAL